MVKAITPHFIRVLHGKRPTRLSRFGFIGALSIVTALVTSPTRVAASVAETCVPVRIMPLGDSLTAGGAGDPQFYDSYRYELWRLMRSADLPAEFVGDQNGPGGVATNPPPDSGLPPGSFAHSGHGGWTISQVSEAVDGWLAQTRPEVVLVNLGTNYETDGARKLTALISQIRKAAPNAVIVSSSLTPFRGELTSTWVDPERKALGEAAAVAGTASGSDRILYADIRTRLTKGTDGVSGPFGPSDYNQLATNDEVHLSPAGGVKFAQAWFPEVRAAIRVMRPLPCQGKSVAGSGTTPTSLGGTSRPPQTTVPQTTTTKKKSGPKATKPKATKPKATKPKAKK